MVSGLSLARTAGDWYISPMIKIILVEDHPVFRSLLSEQIDNQEDMECVGIYGTAPDALTAVEKNPHPDIIILDLGLPSMHGLEALPQFKALAPGTKVMVLTISDDRAKVLEALSLGAHGYVLKTDSMERILAGLRNIMRGEAPMSPAIATMVLGAFHKTPSAGTDAELSNKELEVLKALAKGQARKQVADNLCLSINTVNTHVRHIYEKLKVHNLTGALSKASKGGLI